jgi:hypothetical protein
VVPAPSRYQVDDMSVVFAALHFFKVCIGLSNDETFSLRTCGRPEVLRNPAHDGQAVPGRLLPVQGLNPFDRLMQVRHSTQPSWIVILFSTAITPRGRCPHEFCSLCILKIDNMKRTCNSLASFFTEF